MKSMLVYVCLFALLAGGLCGRLRRQAPPADLDIPVDTATMPTTADTLNDVVAGLITKLNGDVALGKPMDPKKIDTINTLCMVISITGGEVSDANKEAMDQLLTALPAAAPDAAPPAAPAE